MIVNVNPFRVKRKRHSSLSQFKISRTVEIRTRVTRGREGSTRGVAEARGAGASQGPETTA